MAWVSPAVTARVASMRCAAQRLMQAGEMWLTLADRLGAACSQEDLVSVYRDWREVRDGVRADVQVAEIACAGAVNEVHTMPAKRALVEVEKVRQSLRRYGDDSLDDV